MKCEGVKICCESKKRIVMAMEFVYSFTFLVIEKVC